MDAHFSPTNSKSSKTNDISAVPRARCGNGFVNTLLACASKTVRVSGLAVALKACKILKRATFIFIVDIDDCLNVTCSGSGNCSDRLDGYYCYCEDGFYGTNCEIGNGILNNYWMRLSMIS